MKSGASAAHRNADLKACIDDLKDKGQSIKDCPAK